MKGFIVAKISQMIQIYGEEQIKTLLSKFSCPINLDVENFIKQNAISSDKQGFSTTRLVFASYKGAPVLVGYFTLANKVLVVSRSCKLSNRLKSRLNRFGTYNQELKQREIPAPLIAQLGKNFAYAQHKLITGDELLEIATEYVRKALRLLGGRVVYLECEDDPRLIHFYARNGFVAFDDRQMDTEEQQVMRGTRLVQMIKHFDSAALEPVEDKSEIMRGFLEGLM